MKSRTTVRFRKSFNLLPEAIREKAKKSYKLWQADPYLPSLAFKQVVPHQPIFSVRISISYRALGVKEGNQMIWFWIGSHEDYNTLIKEI